MISKSILVACLSFHMLLISGSMAMAFEDGELVKMREIGSMPGRGALVLAASVPELNKKGVNISQYSVSVVETDRNFYAICTPLPGYGGNSYEVELTKEFVPVVTYISK